MRALNKIERSVLITLKDSIKDDRKVDHRNINLAKVIFDHSEANYITWASDKIAISKENPNGLKPEVIYRNLIDIINIIQQMSDSGYILLVKNINDNVRLKREDDSTEYKCSFYLGLGQILKMLSNSVAFPTRKLVEFIDNDFQTEDQIRFYDQMKDAKEKHTESMAKANLQIKIGWAAFVVSIIAVIAAIITPHCTKTSLAEKEEIIKAIESTRIEIPESINSAITNDTLNVKTTNR